MNNLDDKLFQNVDKLFSNIIDTIKNTYLAITNADYIYGEKNYISKQKEINDLFSFILDFVLKKYDQEIAVKIKNEVIEIVKKYIVMIFFLILISKYKYGSATFIQNLIDFTINQSYYHFKVANSFNSKFNNDIITFNYIYINSIQYIEKNLPFNEILKLEGGNLSIEFIKNNKLKLDELKKKYDGITLIYLILIEVYNSEKISIYEYINKSILDDIDFEIIYILERNTINDTVLNHSQIEEFLTIDEINAGNAQDILDMINVKNYQYSKYGNDFYENYEYVCEFKSQYILSYLISKNIINPILDDILLKHDDNELYKIGNVDDLVHTKKINYITSKINYAIDTRKFDANEKLQNGIKINAYEDMNIIYRYLLYNNDLLSQDIKNINNEFIKKNLYSYVETLHNSPIHFIYNENDILNTSITADAYRYSSILSNNEIVNRSINKFAMPNIKGFVIPKSTAAYKSINMKRYKNIKNPLLIPNIISRKLSISKNYTNYNYYWIFDESTNIDMIDSITKKIYNGYTKSILRIIKKMTMIYPIESLDDSDKIKHQIINYYDLKYDNVFINRLNILLHKNSSIYASNYKFITNDKILVKKVTTVQKPTKQKLKIIRLYKTNKTYFNVIEYGNFTCQHALLLDDIIKMSNLYSKNKDENLLKKKELLINQFMDIFIVNVDVHKGESVNNDKLCKSCGELITYFTEFVEEGAYDENNKYVLQIKEQEMELDNDTLYKKYSGCMPQMRDVIVQTFGYFGYNFLMGKINITTKNKIEQYMKNIFDISINLNSIYKTLKNEYSDFSRNAFGLKNSQLLFFDLPPNVFTSKNQPMINMLYIYICICILSFIDKSNYNFFSTIGKIKDTYLSYFKNLMIMVNNKLAEKITNYKLLCYVIYNFADVMIKKNKFIVESENDTIKKSKYIDTFVDALNVIIISSYSKDTLFTEQSKDQNKVRDNSVTIDIFVNVRYILHNNMKSLFKNNDDYKTQIDNFDNDQYFYYKSYLNTKKELNVAKYENIWKYGELFSKNITPYKSLRYPSYILKGNNEKEKISLYEGYILCTKYDEYVYNNGSIIYDDIFHKWTLQQKKILCSKCGYIWNGDMTKIEKQNIMYEYKNVKKIIPRKIIKSDKIEHKESEIIDITNIKEDIISKLLNTVNDNTKHEIGNVNQNNYSIRLQNSERELSFCEDKVKEIENDIIYKTEKTNILHYFNKYNKQYKGYKEFNKDYVDMSKFNDVLAFFPSLNYMISYIGYTNIYIDLYNDDMNDDKYYVLNTKDMIKKILEDRSDNVRQICYDIVRIFTFIIGSKRTKQTNEYWGNKYKNNDYNNLLNYCADIHFDKSEKKKILHHIKQIRWFKDISKVMNYSNKLLYEEYKNGKILEYIDKNNKFVFNIKRLAISLKSNKYITRYFSNELMNLLMVTDDSNTMYKITNIIYQCVKYEYNRYYIEKMHTQDVKSQLKKHEIDNIFIVEIEEEEEEGVIESDNENGDLGVDKFGNYDEDDEQYNSD